MELYLQRGEEMMSILVTKLKSLIHLNFLCCKGYERLERVRRQGYVIWIVLGDSCDSIFAKAYLALFSKAQLV